MVAHPCNDCDPATGLRKPCPECKPVIAGQAMTPPLSAADHERAFVMIEQRTDLNDEQRAKMRTYVEKHYLNVTLNG